MRSSCMNRREFLEQAAATATVCGAAHAASAPSRRSVLNANENMEYRALGNTGLMVSAVCLGGHWKRADVAVGRSFKGVGYAREDYDNINNPSFIRSRHDVVSRSIDVGINYIDACAGPEVLAYSKVLRGRREKVYLGFSWFERETRFREWRTGKKLIEGLDQSLRDAKLDYVDLWRMTLPADELPELSELNRIEEATVEALAAAKKQGKARFTGVSSHNRPWLKSLIEQYPKQIEVVLFPYTARTKELPNDSIFRAIQKHKVGVFGIKPFASNSLFQGDSSPNSPHREEDDRRARLALRYVLGNPAISAPIPGLITPAHVDNAARAVMERRRLDLKEKAELDRATESMWARLDNSHQWLREWEYV